MVNLSVKLIKSINFCCNVYDIQLSVDNKPIISSNFCSCLNF